MCIKQCCVLLMVVFIAKGAELDPMTDNLKKIIELLELKARSAFNIMQLTKESLDFNVQNLEKLSELDIQLLRTTISKNSANQACVEPARNTMHEIQFELLNQADSICKVMDIMLLDGIVTDINNLLKNAKGAPLFCKGNKREDYETCVDKLIGGIKNEFETQERIFTKYPGELNGDVMNCLVKLYNNHILPRVDAAVKTLRECVKN